MNFAKTAIAAFIALAAVPLCAAGLVIDLSSAEPYEAEGNVVKYSLPVGEGVDFRPDIAVGDLIELRVPGGIGFALEVVSAPPPGIAGQSFIARDAGGASAVVKVAKSGMRITVDDFANMMMYTFRCRGDNIELTVRDTSGEVDGECATCVAEGVEAAIPETIETNATVPAPTLVANDAGAFPLAEQKSVVDILVAFDQGAKARCTALSFDSIEEFADYAVGKMNEVLENSQLIDQFCYRLVGVVEIDGTWSKIDGSVLGALRERKGQLSKLSQLRDKYGADTITLLIDRTEGTTSGIAYTYSSSFNASSFDNMNYACNVCDINTVHSRYTMSHETGHNMGCGHSNRQGSNSGPGRYSDSCGYHFVDANNVRRHTVMAYSNASDDSYSYAPIAYFSAPDITPEDYGVPLGVEGVNNNRGALSQTHADIASLREHVFPYDWDVKFQDSSKNEILDGSYFSAYIYVTLYHQNADADIYYTTDGSVPNEMSQKCSSGENIYVSADAGKTVKITACAVVDGVAQSMRSITLTEGFLWSGEQGENGNGRWIATDSSVKAWIDSSMYFYNWYDAVVFPNLNGIDSAVVTVNGSVEPLSSAFPADITSYTFTAGDETALISLPDESFAPSGDLTFDVPVNLSATSFASPAYHNVSFNAPFGTNITAGASYGHCTNEIVVGKCGTLTVAPGAGKTQVFNRLNTKTYYSDAKFVVGEGNVVFNGPYDGGWGLFGNTQVVVGEGGNLVFNYAAVTGFGMTSAFTIENGGMVTFNYDEHMRRPLYLAGGTVVCNARLDRMYAAGITVTGDSEIKGNGRILLRYENERINVADGKTLTLNVPTKDGPNTDGYGFVKIGGGEIVANKELEHSGAAIISNGTFTVGYSSTKACGTGWRIGREATLRIDGGCFLHVPSLELEIGSELSIPAGESHAISAEGAVDLSGILLELRGASNLALGAKYPLIFAAGGFSGVRGVNKSRMPALKGGLGWKLDVEDGVLSASVVNIADADPMLNFLSNANDLHFLVPDDAKATAEGDIEIVSSPILIDGFSTNAVAITLDVVIPEAASATQQTLCSWNVGNNIVRCVVTNGVVDCFYGNNNQHVDNTTNFVAVSGGRHTIEIGYYSFDNNDYGGTYVYVDGEPAYRASTLRWSKSNVSRIAIGATAADEPSLPYEGLVVKNVAVVDATSSAPLPKMTVSGGNVKYNYLASKSPRVFAIAPYGGFAMDQAVLSAEFSSTNDEMAVSVIASFPENAVGTIMCLAVLNGEDGKSISAQVEYEGDGTFAIRDNGLSLDSHKSIQVNEPDTDVSNRHLYTMTYTINEGIRFYQDGVEIVRAESRFNNNGYPAWKRVTFGCGYWTGWMESWNDNPYPMPHFKVYASHIAFDTDDRTVSEAAVLASMAADEPEVMTRLPTVDILVAFDNGAQAYVENKGMGLEEFAAAQIQKMNDALATNRLDACYSYRLAGVCRVDARYSKIGDVSGDLVAGVGPLVTLRSNREILGADTVTLLVDNESDITLGYGCPLSSSTDVEGCHDDAFSVCSISAVHLGSQHTMLHENAHNMGCGHARQQGQANSPFDYGRGYYFTDNNNVSRHTIMAYGTDQGASWYFSTSSDEFGLDLGDADNDNARVLRETCGAVSGWRDCVKPFEDDVVVADASTGEAVISGRVFKNSISVELSATAAGSTIVYTLDGSVPTGSSSVYSAPLEITDDTTLTVATSNGSTISPPRTINLFRRDAIPSEGLWRTSVKYPWTDEKDGSIRSCNHTEYRYYCTTPLAVSIEGPKILTFKHKSYFFTPDYGSNYSHIEVLLDDSAIVSSNYCDTGWSDDVEIHIPQGRHEVQFVYSQRSAMNNPKDNKDVTAEMDDALWIKDISIEDDVLAGVYEVPAGITVELGDIPKGTTRVIGEGTVNCGSELPSDSLGWTNATWEGTIAFNGLSGDACKDFRFELYGNANSKIQLTNCSIPYLNNNNATFAGTLILMDDEGHNAAFSTEDGYSSNYNVFGALEGEGSMYFSGKPKQGYVFNVATNYNGSIEVNADYYGDNLQGRRIVFGNVSSAADLPEQSATITLKSGASASIGPNATWRAHHGIEIAGTLIVKGAGSTLDCNDRGTLTLKFDDGATFRFDADGAKLTLANALKFDSGTVKIAFGNDFELLHGTKLIGWSKKGVMPEGSFKFADSSLESTWQLVKSTEGLSVEMRSDGDGFFDGEAQVGFVKKASLDDWLEGQNFWMYEDYMTWQDFLAEVGSNGYLNWQSFLLGFETENDFRTFDAVIEIVDGAITVRTTEGGVPEGYSSHVEKRIYFKDALDKPWGEGTVMDGKTVDLGAPGNGGFYKVEVMFR